MTRTALGVAAIIAILCLIDFTQRVWVSAPDLTDVNREVEQAAGIDIAEPEINPLLAEWVATRAAERLATAASGAEGSTKDTPPELLPGGVDVGPLRVRLLAIFIPPDGKQQVAIMEAQNSEDRSLELIERTLGESLGDYTVSAVRVNEIVFKRDDEIIAVPIFDYER